MSKNTNVEEIIDSAKSRLHCRGIRSQLVNKVLQHTHLYIWIVISAYRVLQKIDPSKSRLVFLKLRRRSRSAPRLSLSGERRTDDDIVLPCCASKNGFEIQLRGLTYSGVSKRGCLILAHSSPSRVTRGATRQKLCSMLRNCVNR